MGLSEDSSPESICFLSWLGQVPSNSRDVSEPGSDGRLGRGPRLRALRAEPGKSAEDARLAPL